MMKITLRGAVAALCFLFSWPMAAQLAQPIELKPYAGASSPIRTMGADWLVPQGRQVLDGIPFEMNGTIFLQGKNTPQKADRAVKIEISPAHFAKLHLLAGTDVEDQDGATVAKVQLLYADGSEQTLKLNYGEHLRCWQGPWHQAEEPLKSPDAHIAWRRPFYVAAKMDKYLRLFHITLTNPFPDKQVIALSLKPEKTASALMLVAATVAPAAPEILADTVPAPQNPFPDLRPRTGEPARGEGVVKNRAGQPLAHARVRIRAVREFNTDYKTATTKDPAVAVGVETDENGHFVLPPLPDNKLYQIVAGAENHDSLNYRGVDLRSDPVELRLQPVPGASANPKFAVHGRVIGPDGKPRPYASIEHSGVGYQGGTSWGGPQAQGFSDEIIADANGEFTFGRDQPFDRIQLNLTEPGLASAQVWVYNTNSVQTVMLTEGVSLRGRVLKDGRPLTNLVVGVSGTERSSEVYAGSFDARTGTNGEFVFEHLPPNIAWQFFGKIDSFKPHGALPPRSIRSGDDGKTTDLGDLPVVPGIRLAGRIKSRNDEPLPPDLKVWVGYETAMDSQSVSVDEQGRFRFEGLSPTLINVSIEPSAWNLTRENRSIDNLNPWRLVGQLEQDKDDLLLLVQKRPRDYNSYNMSNGRLPASDESSHHPVRGAEASGPPDIILAGRVVDDKTGQAIANFKVVAGHKPPVRTARAVRKPLLNQVLDPFVKKIVPWNEMPFWENSNPEIISNGTFSIPFTPMTSQPMLRIEAVGYEPLVTEPTNQTTTNLVLRLQKGSGPNGVVLLPNGSPAPNASVVFGIAHEQFSLKGTTFGFYSGQTNLQRVTGADGKFAFEPRNEGKTIFVAHPAGWAQQSVERSRDNLSLELRPWATLTGTLVDTNNAPKPGVELALTMFHDWNQGGALANLQNRATTDAQGRFVFSNVPPARVEMQRLIPWGTGYSYQLQTWLFVQPGTNDLGKVTYDQPPPATGMERLKQTLGL